MKPYIYLLSARYFLVRNKIEFLIFGILFIIAISITVYQFSGWEISPDKSYWKSWALFSGDEPFYLELTSTLLHYHSLNPDYLYTDIHRDPALIFPDFNYEVNSCRVHHSLLGRDGHCWSSHQPGVSFLLTPGYAVGGAVGAMITINIIFASQGILIFKFLSNFANKVNSLLVALFFSLTTMELSFSDRIYPDMIAGFFLMLVLYLFFVKKNNTLNVAIVSAALGFLPVLKLEFFVFSILLLPIMIVILLKGKNRDQIITLLTVFTFFILLLVWYLVISTPIEDTPGFAGAYTDLAHTAFSEKIGKYTEYLTKGFGNLLFGRSYGLFAFSPIALVSLFGMKYLWNANRSLAAAIVVIFSLFVLGFSLTAPYSAGWTLPSRYLMPILPLTTIPLVLLFQNFLKKIIFQSVILLTSYIGLSLNILFVRIIYAHPTVNMRANILNQVYLGGASVFPYIGESTDPSAISNFWNTSGPLFWIFLGSIVTLFFTFTTYSKIKRAFTNLKRQQKYIILSILLVICAVISIFAYEAVYEYRVELQITEFYQNILGRSPDAEGLSHWENEVLHNGQSLEWVASNLQNSPEGMATAKITSFYNEILHRQPDPAGLAYWKKAVLDEGKSYDWVENMIRNSVEARNLQQ